METIWYGLAYFVGVFVILVIYKKTKIWDDDDPHIQGDLNLQKWGLTILWPAVIALAVVIAAIALPFVMINALVKRL
jgi:polyferredoxin